jgi:hypothetical protein
LILLSIIVADVKERIGGKSYIPFIYLKGGQVTTGEVGKIDG